MQILGVSGSLRAQSKNTLLLEALSLLAPSEVTFSIYRELAGIPAFNPDLETGEAVGSVERFREAIRESAAVLFSTPEYAHGVPGSLKNALDWIVGSGELSRKPVVLVNASSRGVYAQNSLREILSTMDARVHRDAELTIDLPGAILRPEQVADTPEFAAVLKDCWEKITRVAAL